MTKTDRTMLTFSVSSGFALTHLEQAFVYHRDVTTGSSYNDEEFILAVECPDTTRMVWAVCSLIARFDPESIFCRQASLSHGAYVPPAA